MNSSYGIIGASIFFLVFVGVAYIVFRVLKRTVKMAIRMAIVGLILLIAAVGGLSLLWFGSGVGEKPKTNSTRAK
jgi:hypothetical protein